MAGVYEATVVKDGGWYVGWIDDSPGVNAQAGMLEELDDDLKEGIKLMLDVQVSDPHGLRKTP